MATIAGSVVALLTAGVEGAPAAGATGVAGSQPPLVVLLKRSVSRSEAFDLARAAGARPERYLGVVLRAIRVTASPDQRAMVVKRLRADPNVAAVEPDQREELPEPRSGFRVPGQQSVAVSATQANRATRRPRCSRVAVLDTGVDARHPALRGRVVDSYDALRQTRVSVARDPHGHGTHVAGIIAARRTRGALGRRVAGFCRQVQIVSVRVLDANGRGYASDVAQGIIYATSAGVRVLNLSFGYTAQDPSEVEERAVRFAASRGVFIAVSAGNSSLNIDVRKHWPAAYSETCATASTTADGRRIAPFSNYGPQLVPLAAAGSNILSTWPGGRYTYSTGTSMAAPDVAAAAAALRRRHTWSGRRIRQRLLVTVRRGPGLARRVRWGGALDFDRATR
jgi:Subtilase family